MAFELQAWLLDELLPLAKQAVEAIFGPSRMPPRADFEWDGSNVRVSFNQDKRPLQITDTKVGSYIDGDDISEAPIIFYLSDSKHKIKAVIPRAVAREFEKRHGKRVTQDAHGGFMHLKKFEVVVSHYKHQQGHFYLYITDFTISGCEVKRFFGKPSPIEAQENVKEVVQEIRKYRQEGSPQTHPSSRRGSVRPSSSEGEGGGLRFSTQIHEAPVKGSMTTTTISTSIGLDRKSAQDGAVIPSNGEGATKRPRTPSEPSPGQLNSRTDLQALMHRGAHSGADGLLDDNSATKKVSHDLKNPVADKHMCTHPSESAPTTPKIEKFVVKIEGDSDEGSSDSEALDARNEGRQNPRASDAANHDRALTVDEAWANLRLTKNEVTVPKRQRKFFETHSEDCWIPAAPGKGDPYLCMPREDLNECTEQAEAEAKSKAEPCKNSEAGNTSFIQENHESEDGDVESDSESEGERYAAQLPPNSVNIRSKDSTSPVASEEIIEWSLSPTPPQKERLPPDTDDEKNELTVNRNNIVQPSGDHNAESETDNPEYSRMGSEMQATEELDKSATEGNKSNHETIKRREVDATSKQSKSVKQKSTSSLNNKFSALSDFDSESELEITVPHALPPKTARNGSTVYTSTPESPNIVSSDIVQVKRTPYLDLHNQCDESSCNAQDLTVVQASIPSTNDNDQDANREETHIEEMIETKIVNHHQALETEDSPGQQYRQDMSKEEPRLSLKHRLGDVEVLEISKKRIRTGVREDVPILLEEDEENEISDPASRVRRDRRAFYAQIKAERVATIDARDHSSLPVETDVHQNATAASPRSPSAELFLPSSAKKPEAPPASRASPELPTSRPLGGEESSRGRPENEKSASLAPEDPADALFNTFKETYPVYKGSRAHFENMLRRIQKLSGQEYQPHRSMWDDFIIRFTLEYREYISKCNEEGEDPMPYEKFHWYEIQEALFTRRIMTPSNIGLFVPREETPRPSPSRKSSTPPSSINKEKLRVSPPSDSTRQVHNSSSPPNVAASVRSTLRKREKSPPKASPRSLPWQRQSNGHHTTPSAISLPASSTSPSRLEYNRSHQLTTPESSSHKQTKSPNQTPRSVLSYNATAMLAASNSSPSLAASSKDLEPTTTTNITTTTSSVNRNGSTGKVTKQRYSKSTTLKNLKSFKEKLKMFATKKQ